MNKMGNVMIGWILVILVSLALVGGGIVAFNSGLLGGTQVPSEVVITSGVITTAGACSSACPTDLDWAGTINLRNGLNTSGSQNFDTAMYFYTSDGTLKTTITDTTSGAATLTCGDTYNVQLLSAGGANGNSSKFRAGSGYTLVNGGDATFLACGSGNTVTFVGGQHGLPEVRARDIVNDAFLIDRGDTSGTDYDTTDGVVWNSTSATGSGGITINSGGEFHVIQYMRAQTDDVFINDLGAYVLIDADTTEWNTAGAVAKFDGVVAEEVSALLNSNEEIAYNTYELVYFFDAKDIGRTNEVAFDFQIFALGGTNPAGAANISIDWAPIGRYASSADSNVLKVGSVDDSSSRSDIHTRWDSEYWII